MCKGAPGSISFSCARHNVTSRHGASLECDEAKFPLKGWSLLEFSSGQINSEVSHELA